jgi:galactokinase
MVAEKDDWVERNAAPFIWVSHEAANSKPIDTSQIEKVDRSTIREESKKVTEVVPENEDSNLEQPLLRDDKSKAIVVPSGEREVLTKEEYNSRQKKASTRAKMLDFGRKMGDKLEEKRRHIEEKSRHIVEKMKENARAER